MWFAVKSEIARFFFVLSVATKPFIKVRKMGHLCVSDHALSVAPKERPALEIEMRFVSAKVPWAELAAMKGFKKTDSVYRETLDVASQVRLRVDVHDGTVNCVRKEQLTRIFYPDLDRYVHINKETDCVTPPTTTCQFGVGEIRRTSFAPHHDDDTCPHVDVTLKQAGDPIIEVECAPFTATDDENTIIAKCRNFEEMCGVVHRLLKLPLGQFNQPMPLALTRDKLKLATGKNYLTSLKLDGVRRLVELRLYVTPHRLGRRGTVHLYASRTMTLLQQADIVSDLTPQVMPSDVGDMVTEKGHARIHLLIDSEEVGRTLHILDMADAENGNSDDLMLRLRKVREWLPLLQQLFVTGSAAKLYDHIKVKPYFAEAVLKHKCAINLQKKDLQVRVDGLIFSPNRPMTNTLFRTIYKWKEASASTIDLLYHSNDLLVTTTSRYESILHHFPGSFTIDHSSLNAHTVQQGAIVECRINDYRITCIGVRRDKVYPNTLKTCLHTLKVVNENITLDELITHFT